MLKYGKVKDAPLFKFRLKRINCYYKIQTDANLQNLHTSAFNPTQMIFNKALHFHIGLFKKITCHLL